MGIQKYIEMEGTLTPIKHRYINRNRSNEDPCHDRRGDYKNGVTVLLSTSDPSNVVYIHQLMYFEQEKVYTYCVKTSIVINIKSIVL